MTDELYDKNKLGLHFGVSANPLVYRTIKKYGRISFPHPEAALIRIRDIDLYTKKNKLTKRTLLKYGFYATKVLNAQRNPPQRLHYANEIKLKITEVKKFDERIDDFWEEIKNNYNYIIETNKEYLNWRYCDPRGGKYVIKQAEEDGKIVGYIALKVNCYDKDFPTGYVVSLCTLQGRYNCARALIAESVNFFDGLGINIVNYCTIKGHPYEGLFKERGFLDSSMRIYVNYIPKNIGRELVDFNNSPPNKLLFQYGDFDWI